MTIDEAHANVGRRVSFTGPVDTQHGVITRAGPRYCYVQYDGDTDAQCTEPETINLTEAGQ